MAVIVEGGGDPRQMTRSEPLPVRAPSRMNGVPAVWRRSTLIGLDAVCLCTSLGGGNVREFGLSPVD
jgi:hypothetical protein